MLRVVDELSVVVFGLFENWIIRCITTRVEWYMQFDVDIDLNLRSRAKEKIHMNYILNIDYIIICG